MQRLILIYNLYGRNEMTRDNKVFFVYVIVKGHFKLNPMIEVRDSFDRFPLNLPS